VGRGLEITHLTGYYPMAFSFKTHEIHGDQKVSANMITLQKFTSTVQSVPRQSPDIY
jgi:hypothetical protein